MPPPNGLTPEAGPPLYDQDPEASMAYWAGIITGPLTAERIRGLEPSDPMGLQEFTREQTQALMRLRMVEGDRRKPLRDRLRARRDRVRLLDANHHWAWEQITQDGAPVAMCEPSGEAEHVLRDVVAGSRWLLHRRPLRVRRRAYCGGRRRGARRRTVSRSAGGGSSGDPDSDGPAEGRQQHNHLGTDHRGSQPPKQGGCRA